MEIFSYRTYVWRTIKKSKILNNYLVGDSSKIYFLVFNISPKTLSNIVFNYIKHKMILFKNIPNGSMLLTKALKTQIGLTRITSK